MPAHFAPPFAVLLLAPAAFAADEKPLTYDEHVLPILRANCVGCHNNDRQEGGLNMVQFAALMQGGGSGEVITAGDGEFSYLYMLAAHESEPVMPPNGGKMAAADLDILRKWIDTGARENAGSKVTLKPKEDLSLGAAPVGRPDGPPPMPPNPYAPDPEGGPVALSVTPIPVEGRSPGDRADAVTALAASPWAPLVAVGGEGQVTLYHADALEPWGVLPFPEGRPRSLKFSTNGRLLIAGGGRGAYRGLAVVWDVTTGARVAEVGEEPDAVLCADISPDQSQIVIGTTSKKAKVFATATGKLLYTIDKPTDWALSVAFSPDGVLLAVGDRAGNLGLWEAASGLPYADLRGHKDAVTAAVWRADSNLLATASLDDTVHLWNPEDGGLVRKVDVKAGGVEAAAFAADGTFATAGRSGEVAVWDANGKKLKAFPKRPDYALSVAVADEAVGPEGQRRPRVFAGDWTGAVIAGNPADGAVVGEFTPNPPPPAVRLAAAEAALNTAAAAVAAADKARSEAAAALAKAEAAKAAAEKTVAAVKAAQTAAAERKATLAKAVTAARSEVGPAREAADEAAAVLKTLTAAAAEAATAAEGAGEEDPAAVAAAASRTAADAAAEAADLAAADASAAAAEAERSAADLAAAEQALKALPARLAAAENVARQAAAAVAPAAEKKKTRVDAVTEPAAAADRARAVVEGLRHAAARDAAGP